MSLKNPIGFLLSTTGRKISQFLTNRFLQYDITSEQWTVLNRLAEKDGISQKELSQRTEKDPTNITRILDQLERKRLVTRATNAEDRRSFLAYITEKGRALNEILTPIETDTIQDMLFNLSAEDIAGLERILYQINDNMDKMRKESEPDK